MVLSRDMGIDLGTSNVRVYVRRRGIVLREPSVVAKHRKNGSVWVGEEAEKMLGRTPEVIVASRPMVGGVIADYSMVREMLRYFIRHSCGGYPLVKPLMVISVPIGRTGVEERSVRSAAREAGARDALTVLEPTAAAIGAGLPIAEAVGNMVVDIGGGTTDVAVLSLNNIVVADSIRVGGARLDECIIRHIKRDHNLMVGERSAEDIKIRIGSAYTMEPEVSIEVRGRDLVTGLPKTVMVSSVDVREALREPLTAIVDRVKHVLEETPPELASDIIERGITLTGGGALLRGIDRLIADETGIPTRVAEDPLSCVANGTGLIVDSGHADRWRAERRY